MPVTVQEGWHSIVRKPGSPRAAGRGGQISTDPGCFYELATDRSGDTGLDLAVAATVTISDGKLHAVPSTCTGPLGNGLSALLLGKASASQQGLFVLPRNIDVDYTGPIDIILNVFAPPVTIPAGSKIAHLIFFKSKKSRIGTGEQNEGLESVESLQTAFCEQITMQRPQRHVTFISENGQMLAAIGMIDTGSDITIIPASFWPPEWPAIQASSVMGIGESTVTKISKQRITVRDEEGNVAWTTPYIVHTPLCIIGRDVLSQWGLSISSNL